ncbi:MAG: hypothetical protein ACLSGI_10395 [Butyricicoccaceae bacterium]
MCRCGGRCAERQRRWWLPRTQRAHRSPNTGDRFLHGGVNELYRHCGIDAEGIAAYIMKNRNGKENGVG